MKRTDPGMGEMKDPRGTAFGHGGYGKYLPIAIVAAGLALGYAAGLQDYLSLKVLADKREALGLFVANHYAAAILAYCGIYIVAVAFSFPAASVLTVFGGVLFGWLVGGALTAVAATIGATAIFLAARSAFGGVLRRRAGPFAAKLADGFEKDALCYLFVLRLAPVLPFFAVNVAPAFFDVRLRTYVTATFFGILPATFAYSWFGQGIDSVIASASAAGREVALSDLVTPEITAAFVILALVAALSPVIRRWRNRTAARRPAEPTPRKH